MTTNAMSHSGPNKRAKTSFVENEKSGAMFVYTCITESCYRVLQTPTPTMHAKELKVDMFQSLRSMSTNQGRPYIPLFPDKLSAALACVYHSYTAVQDSEQHLQRCAQSEPGAIPQMVLLVLQFSQEDWVEMLSSAAISARPTKPTNKKRSIFAHWQYHKKNLDLKSVGAVASAVKLDLEMVEEEQRLTSALANAATAS